MSEAFRRCLPDWELHRAHFDDGLGGEEFDNPVWVDDEGLLSLARSRKRPGDRYQLRFSDQISVDIGFDDRSVMERPLASSIPQSTREHFLADQVLPRILGHQGRLVLHAGAVRRGERAFLLLGQSGSGKSTLAAGFDRAGYGLLGDDALVVSWEGDRPRAGAVYPSLRLFPDSIDALFPPAVATATVAHYTPKLRVGMPFNDADHAADLPISAVFVIGEPSSNSEIRVRPKSIAEACMAFVQNSFVLDPTDITRAPGRLHDASELARQVPVFDLSYPRAYARLADVQAAILETLERSGLERE